MSGSGAEGPEGSVTTSSRVFPLGSPAEPDFALLLPTLANHEHRITGTSAPPGVVMHEKVRAILERSKELTTITERNLEKTLRLNAQFKRLRIQLRETQQRRERAHKAIRNAS